MQRQAAEAEAQKPEGERKEVEKPPATWEDVKLFDKGKVDLDRHAMCYILVDTLDQNANGGEGSIGDRSISLKLTQKLVHAHTARTDWLCRQCALVLST